ncbi:MAG TPA: cation:proton antiporter, partial [Actinopolymorphaceae bacterium]
METTAYVYLAAGVAALLAALLPRLLSRVPVSPPMVFLGLGIIGYTLASDAPVPDPIDYRGYTEHLAELTVIVSLMGAGLALDRPFGRRNWQSTWRLLAITMPLSIGVVALLGWWALGLAPAAAMLLGAALAPTDPVLASDVQVGEPLTEDVDRPEGEDPDEPPDEDDDI